MTSIITVEASGHECDVKLQVWLKDILPYTPGLIRKIATRELVLAAREFFEKSFAWRAVLGPRQIKANKKRYSLSPYDAYTDIVGVLGVEVQGTPINPLARKPGDTTRTSNRPYGYWLESPDTVILYPIPTATLDNALTLEVALTPKQSVTHLPRIAQTHFYEALLSGVLNRVYAHPSKPYSNPILADYHGKKFRNAIAYYAGRAKNGFAGGGTWCYPKFGK